MSDTRIPEPPAGSPDGRSLVYRNITPLLCVFDAVRPQLVDLQPDSAES